MLAYFFAFRYIMEIYISRKKAICLGSITKCHVIRTDGGFQVGYKKDPPKTTKRVICLANYSFCGLLGVLGVFVLYLKNHSDMIFKRFGEGGRNKRRQLSKS